MANRFFIIAVVLSAVGVLVQSLFGFGNALSQLSFVILSLIMSLVIFKLDILWIIKTSHLFSLLGIALLTLLLILADPIRGAQRWFVIGSFNLQPSVVFVPFFILSAALLLSNLENYSAANLLKTLGLILVPVALIFKQPDLGTAIVVGWTLFNIAFVAPFSLKLFAGLIVSGIPLVLIGSRFLKTYQVNRLISFINPAFDPGGINYNSLQSVIAIGSGFLIGKGFNASSQSQLFFLPESHTDFVFAALSEAFGFVGAAIVLSLIFWFMFSLLIEIRRSDKPVFRYYAFGVLAYFFVQTLFNVGMNMRLLPVVGVPLPFISYGGSSLLASFVMLAIAKKLNDNT